MICDTIYCMISKEEEYLFWFLLESIVGLRCAGLDLSSSEDEVRFGFSRSELSRESIKFLVNIDHSNHRCGRSPSSAQFVFPDEYINGKV